MFASACLSHIVHKYIKLVFFFLELKKKKNLCNQMKLLWHNSQVNCVFSLIIDSIDSVFLKYFFLFATVAETQASG